MHGGHDLGGMDGLGPIRPEAEDTEPVFHDDWERRAFALTLACGFLGQWNLDESRHARERQHPAQYLQNTYYENWLTGLETLLQEKGMLEPGNAAELCKKRIHAEKVSEILSKGGPVDVPTDARPRFGTGDQVRVRIDHINGHTRTPRYTLGREGIVSAVHGCHVYPDDNARGERRGEFLYSVSFEASALWGAGADQHSKVFVDLWEPYLNPA